MVSQSSACVAGVCWMVRGYFMSSSHKLETPDKLVAAVCGCVVDWAEVHTASGMPTSGQAKSTDAVLVYK